MRCRLAVLDVLQRIFSPGLWARGACSRVCRAWVRHASRRWKTPRGVPSREGWEDDGSAELSVPHAEGRGQVLPDDPA